MDCPLPKNVPDGRQVATITSGGQTVGTQIVVVNHPTSFSQQFIQETLDSYSHLIGAIQTQLGQLPAFNEKNRKEVHENLKQIIDGLVEGIKDLLHARHYDKARPRNVLAR